MKIYFATWIIERDQGETLSKMKVFKRLLSYFFLCSQKIKKRGFEEYVKTGMFDPRKKKT